MLRNAATQGEFFIVRTVAELRARVSEWHGAGLTVGLVPTMGALHAGHLSLLSRAQREAKRVIATVFVNPTQFGPNEDFARYPRREAEDADKLAATGAHLLFAPPVEEMYPDGFSTTVTVAGLTDCLCGPRRPGHFAGVATVVAKLLIQAQPEVAIFGEKDYQQLQVITRLARDLDIPTRIVGSPTVREADGLALSSRNAYLTPEQRAAAPTLYKVLTAVAQQVAAGDPAAAPLAWGLERLTAVGFGPVDYLELRTGDTLESLTEARPGARVFAAAWLGRTRLIDNIPVPLPLAG